VEACLVPDETVRRRQHRCVKFVAAFCSLTGTEYARWANIGAAPTTELDIFELATSTAPDRFSVCS
jgi:hypothetical protein